jgi:AraC-like DNA-binding protein
MTLSYLNVISVIILFQLTLLVLFLVTSKKGRKVSNRLLALFFVLLIINLADGLLTYYGFYTKYTVLAHLEDGFVFLLGPTIYFYVMTMIYHDFRLRLRHLFHASPFLVVTIAYQLYYHLQSDEKRQMIQDAIVRQTLPPFFYISVVLIYIHIAIYLFLSLTELRRYRQRIRERFSSLGQINMNWLAFMLWSIVFILSLSLIYTFVPLVGLRDYFNIIFGMSFFLIFFFINGVVWRGLRQPEIFSGIEIPSGTLSRKATSLTHKEIAEISQKVRVALEERKVFLAPDLSLDSLAATVGFPARKVSQVINDTFHQNFFEFINTYRIKEAERIFRETIDPRVTVLEVMYASGFNSKSSFNTLFKQKTGFTPSDYKRRFSSAANI